MTDMVPTLLNGRWELLLPKHRAERPQWTKPPYWEPERLTSMAANIRPGDVVFDVGAEEGDITALCATWARDDNRTGGVVAIEPNPRVWPNIRAIFEANELPIPLGCFVGFADEETEARADAATGEAWPECAFGPVIGDHGFRNVCEAGPLRAAAENSRWRLDDIADACGLPDVITIDVEGAEFHVLRGARRILLECSPIVYVSVHPEFMRDMYGEEDADLLTYMSSLGYRSRLLAVDHEQHFVFWRGTALV